MIKNVSSDNFLFILALAFEFDWNFVKDSSKDNNYIDSSFFELFSFFLLKKIEFLIKHGLFRSFLNIQEETKRLQGKICLQEMLKKALIKSDSLICEFDDLSFNIIENQILLSTLKYCSNKLDDESIELTTDRKKIRKSLRASISNIIRLLSSKIQDKKLSKTLFAQIYFHRVNIHYRPIIQLCEFIYQCSAVCQKENGFSYDTPDKAFNRIYEIFLRNYLSKELRRDNLKVKKNNFQNWILSSEKEQPKNIPNIKPDIVIWKDNIPKLVLDAKYYNSPVYKASFFNSVDQKDDNNTVYKTHSSNLYQIFTYSNYLNCDGLLVYVQNEFGSFKEMVKINPEYNKNNLLRFGFMTLDLSNNIDKFKNELINFVYQIKEIIKDR